MNMQIPFENSPRHSRPAMRQEWFPFLALAVCLLLLPAESQATVGKPIPGIDVSVGKKPGEIAVSFTNKVRFAGWVGDMIDVTTTNALFPSTNTAFQVTAGGVLDDQFVIVEVNHTNDSIVATGTTKVTAISATVSVSSNAIVVSNLGSSGQDGIAVSTRQGAENGIELGYLPVDLSDAGAQMAFAMVGDVNGSSNVVTGSLSLSNSAPGRLSMRSDVSGVGATQVVVSVYLAGALVSSTVMADGDLGELVPDTTSYTNNVPTGYSLIANQLDHGSNTADEVFSNPTGGLDFSSILKWNGTRYDVAYFDSGSPSGFSDSGATPIPAPTVNPGEAFFFNNQSGGPLSITFTGVPHVPVLPAALPYGYGQVNYLSRQTNDIGTYANIVGLPPTSGAQEQTWNGAGYTIYTYTNGVWAPTNPPSLAVGQGAVFIVPTGTTPPAITQQPISQTNVIGGNITFSVTAVGTPPLSCQWSFNITNILSGATNATYNISNAQPTDAGTYSVMVANASGSVTSSSAGLSLFYTNPPPVTNYSINIHTGYNLIANQLDHGSNTLDEIMPNIPNGCVLSKYDNASGTWKTASFFDVWTELSGPITLNPGEGAFLQSPTNFTLIFTGTPHVPVLPVSIPGGATYLLSRQTNDIGNYTNIVGISPANLTKIYQWNGSSYTVFQRVLGAWNSGGADGPTVAVGEAVWIAAPGGGLPPPIPQSLVYQGLTNTSLGNALIANQLDHGSNSLVVSNLGSSGQDGVSIALNPGNNFAGSWLALDPSNTLPVGAYVQNQMIGTAGAVHNGVLGWTRCTKAGTSNYVITVDYTPLGSSSHTVQVYNGSVLVAQVTGQTGALCATVKLPPGTCTINPWLNDEWPSPTLITISGGPMVLGTEILMIPEGAAPVSSITAEQILAANIPAITITNESVSVTYAGLTQTVLGNATLSLIANQLDHGSNTLDVANIGSSGQDGVSIALPGNLALDVGWRSLDPSNTLPVGAYVQEHIIGTAGSITNGVLGTVTMTKAGTSNYVVSADFSPIGATHYTVQAYRNGVSVAQATNQNGASLAVCNIWGASGCIPLPPILGGGSDWETNQTGGPLPLVTIGGGASVTCDHLYVTPENVPGTPTALQITASQIPILTLTSVLVSPLTVNLTRTPTALTLQWFGTGTPQQSSDLKTWTDITNVVSPYLVPIGPTNQFYRISSLAIKEQGIK
jgi:hypothetical protein